MAGNRLHGIAADAGLKSVVEARLPFPQHLTYAAGTIRPSRFTQAEQDDQVRAYYDVWKSRYLLAAGVADGSPLYRVSFGSTNPARTVSEGQGYGMVIVASMAGHDPDAQSIFDGLWKFSRNYPSAIDPRLMAWEVPVGGGSDSAFDGDSDIAYALLLADSQWGGDGSVDYLAEARTVIAAILASTIGPESRLPLLGDWVRPDGETTNQYTPRSSDFMPAHFRAFGRASADPVWQEIVTRVQAVISYLQTSYSPAIGLLPDFIVPRSPDDHTPRPAPPNFLEAETDGDYSYNAGRDPWRIGIDALINADEASRTQAGRIADWAKAATGGDPLALHAGYHLDGTPLPGRDHFTIFYAAPIGVAAMLDPANQQWLDALYDTVHARHEDYYEDSVTLLSLLVMTGNAWNPATPAPAPQRRRAIRC
jgi:Endoglucanase Y